jgi:hypothetical protein
MKKRKSLLLTRSLCLSIFILVILAGPLLAASATENVTMPPGTMPVVYLHGSAYEMGYQYGQQAGEYIQYAVDGLWAELKSRHDISDVLKHMKHYEKIYKEEFTKFDVLAMMKGIAAGAKDSGYNVTYEGIFLLNQYIEYMWVKLPDLPDDMGCSCMAAWGKATADGGLTAGSSLDHAWGNWHSYMVLIVAYPENGNAFMGPAIAGRLNDNFIINEKGIVNLGMKGSNDRPEDVAYGFDGFVQRPYVAITCDTVEENVEFIKNNSRSNGMLQIVVDENGGYLLEWTADPKMFSVRKFESETLPDYLAGANHFTNSQMKEAQVPWEKPDTSTWYRHQTLIKSIEDNWGKIDAKKVMDIYSNIKYWSGKAWKTDSGLEGLAVNTQRVAGSTMHAKVVTIKDGKITLNVTTGNPGTGAYWGGAAPGLTGQFVEIGFGDSPRATTSSLRSTTESEMRNLGIIMNKPNVQKKMEGNLTVLLVESELDQMRTSYWTGVRYYILAELEKNERKALDFYGKASSEFSKAQAEAKRLGYLLSQ